jgi:hypothetical protein
MSEADFRPFFQRATGFEPLPFQVQAATRGKVMPSLLSVPTGMGNFRG